MRVLGDLSDVEEEGEEDESEEAPPPKLSDMLAEALVADCRVTPEGESGALEASFLFENLVGGKPDKVNEETAQLSLQHVRILLASSLGLRLPGARGGCFASLCCAFSACSVCWWLDP